MACRNYFSELDKSVLTELVNQHKDILESKKNDFRCIKKKNDMWKVLTEEFNSQNGVSKRDQKQLKKCWDNIKSRAKKTLSKERRETKLTGGGNQPPQADESARAVASIIPSQIESLDNRYDDDAIHQLKGM